MKRREKSVLYDGVLAMFCCFALLLSSCGTDTSGNIPSTSATITGGVVEAYSNGRFVVWTPKQDDETESQGMMMMSASSSREPSSLEDTINIVGEAPINTDGSFSLTITVSEPAKVNFYVLDATTEDGRTLAPSKGQQFILEPGELTITMDRNRQFTVTGGHFNDEVINSWKRSTEYLDIQQALAQVRVTPEDETEEQHRERMDELSSLSNRLLDLEVEELSQLASKHEEPQVRKLALQMSWLVSDWYWEALVALAELMPDDEWVQAEAIKAKERIALKADQVKIAIGTEILDFSAEYLSGETISLDELQQEKSLVLLEFWASWCGPCRVEIPHMKKAYDRFKDKGFEIVSFTIDDDKEDWELASEEEELPWPNLGMGQEAEAAKKYSVTGVPANYLFDAKTGTIVARDLRGHKLDEMLEKKLL